MQHLNNMKAPVAMNNRSKLEHYFTTHKSEIAAALPKHLTADRMSRLAMTTFSQNKTLQECDPRSIFASVILASQLGLEIGVLGQGYLVPRKGQCQFIIGWQGIVDLVNRTGKATVWTGAVFNGDFFEYSLGDKPYIDHKPCGEDDPAMITHVYAVGRVKGAEWPIIEVWPIRRVLSHLERNLKANNQQAAKHYSNNNLEMYARKLPLLQVVKYLPKSVELNLAMTADSAYEAGKRAEFINGEFTTVEADEPEQQQQEPQEVAEPVEQAQPEKPAPQATPRRRTFE